MSVQEERVKPNPLDIGLFYKSLAVTAFTLIPIKRALSYTDKSELITGLASPRELSYK